MFFSAAEVGGASGPLIMGAIHDATGGFSACLWFLASIAAGLVSISVRLRQITASPSRQLAPGE